MVRQLCCSAAMQETGDFHVEITEDFLFMNYLKSSEFVFESQIIVWAAPGWRRVH